MSEALEGFYPSNAPPTIARDPFMDGIENRPQRAQVVKGFGSIDPGYNGAIGIIDRAGRRVLALIDTPVHRNAKGRPETYDVLAMFAVAERLRELCEVVYIERQQPMHGKGTSGEQVGFSIGFGYGIWIAVLMIARVPFVEIAPISWKTKAGVMPPRPAKGSLAKLTADERRKRTARNRDESEAKVIEMASTLYEGFDFYNLKRTAESEKASPDRAVVVVLAHVGRRLHLGLV